MAILVILPSENAILSDRNVMHSLDKDVFSYLCERTDWDTGYIGVKSAVSHARIAMDLSENISRKKRSRQVAVKQTDVENSIKRMVKMGLFVRESIQDIRKSRYRLVLIRCGWLDLLSKEDNADARQLLGLTKVSLRNKNYFNNDLVGVTPSSSNSSDVPVAKSSSYIHTNKRDDKFKMSLGWQPDRDYVEQFLQVSGFSSKQVQKVWFGEYVQYWSTQPVLRDQQEWNTHFARHMQFYLLNPNRFDQLNGIVKGVTPGRRSNNKASKPIIVPRLSDGAELQRWAVSKGLRSCPTGIDTRGYYQMLVADVERMNMANERKVHGKK